MLGCIFYTLCFYKHPFVDCSKMAIAEGNFIIPNKSIYSCKMKDLIRLLLTPNPELRPDIESVC